MFDLRGALPGKTITNFIEIRKTKDTNLRKSASINEHYKLKYYLIKFFKIFIFLRKENK